MPKSKAMMTLPISKRKALDMAGTAQRSESESSGEVNLPIKRDIMTYSVGSFRFDSQAMKKQPVEEYQVRTGVGITHKLWIGR
jgi:hypothetical protein